MSMVVRMFSCDRFPSEASAEGGKRFFLSRPEIIPRHLLCGFYIWFNSCGDSNLPALSACIAQAGPRGRTSQAIPFITLRSYRRGLYLDSKNLPRAFRSGLYGRVYK